MGGLVRPVSVPIPPADLWKLEVVAEARGMKLDEFLYQSAMTVAGLGRVEGKESIAILHSIGLTIPQIARRLDTTNLAVSSRLRKLGLKSNKPTTTRKAS